MLTNSSGSFFFLFIFIFKKTSQFSGETNIFSTLWKPFQNPSLSFGITALAEASVSHRINPAWCYYSSIIFICAFNNYKYQNYYLPWAPPTGLETRINVCRSCTNNPSFFLTQIFMPAKKHSYPLLQQWYLIWQRRQIMCFSIFFDQSWHSICNTCHIFIPRVGY